MSSRVLCLGMLASSLGISQYIKPFDFSQYGRPNSYGQYVKPFKGPDELRRSTRVVVETAKVCVVPLLEFKPQVRSRMPVIEPTAPTAPMPKFEVPPACPAKTSCQ